MCLLLGCGFNDIPVYYKLIAFPIVFQAVIKEETSQVRTSVYR